ncbi:MAG: DUF1127 domain-containing protein [Dongiaceae bacterium]
MHGDAPRRARTREQLQARVGQGQGSGTIGALAAGLAAWAMFWSERTRQRRRLAALDDRILKDIGLSRADVMSESDKPFWRA